MADAVAERPGFALQQGKSVGALYLLCQLATWQRQVQKAEIHLAEHPRARVATARRRLAATAKRPQLHSWATLDTTRKLTSRRK